MDFSELAVSGGDWIAWGGLLILGTVAIATHRESRVLLAAIAGCVVAPNPATLFVVALFAVVWRILDGLRLGRQ
jgi:hypothetical protein